MALGYCMLCQQLKPIVPGAHKWGSRERCWFPVIHEAPYFHLVDGTTPCGPLTADEDVPNTFECTTCHVSVDYSGVRGGGLCDGHKREIK